MSNVYKFPVQYSATKPPSSVEMVSDLDLGHEVARYCLERMLQNGEINDREFDTATSFIDFSYLSEKLGL